MPRARPSRPLWLTVPRPRSADPVPGHRVGGGPLCPRGILAQHGPTGGDDVRHERRRQTPRRTGCPRETGRETRGQARAAPQGPHGPHRDPRHPRGALLHRRGPRPVGATDHLQYRASTSRRSPRWRATPPCRNTSPERSPSRPSPHSTSKIASARSCSSGTRGSRSSPGPSPTGYAVSSSHSCRTSSPATRSQQTWESLNRTVQVQIIAVLENKSSTVQIVNDAVVLNVLPLINQGTPVDLGNDLRPHRPSSDAADHHG